MKNLIISLFAVCLIGTGFTSCAGWDITTRTPYGSVITNPDGTFTVVPPKPPVVAPVVEATK